MVKTKGPSISAEASGKLADVLIFSKSPRTQYAKTHRRPRNPRSGGQVGIRVMMKFLAQQWKDIIPTRQATWQEAAQRMDLYRYHAYISHNQINWRSFLGATQMDNYTGTWLALDTPDLRLFPKTNSVLIDLRAIGSGSAWGYTLFRSQTSGFTAAIDTCVKIFRKGPLHKTLFLDTPVTPGTYYYRAGGFRWYGALCVPTAEKTVTVT